jgi:hypothetical protein
VAGIHTEWIHRSIRTAVCTEQIPFSADGSSSTPLQTLQSCPPLELLLPSSPAALVVTLTDSPCFSLCVSVFSCLCHSSDACKCARCMMDLLHIPIFVQVQASAAAVRRMHQVLRDAAFLDDLSCVLHARFITYNHPHETFCTVEMHFVQGRNGAFYGKVLLLPHGWETSGRKGSAARQLVILLLAPRKRLCLFIMRLAWSKTAIQ